MSMHKENKNKEGIACMRILDREVFSKYTGILIKIITAITTNLFFFSWPLHEASSLHWKHKILTTGPPGKSNKSVFNEHLLLPRSMLGMTAFNEYSGILYEKSVSSHSIMSDSAIPWTVVHQALLSMGFPRQEHWNG